MKLGAIPYMRGAVHGTVKWCIENLLESSPAPVSWVMMKVSAVIDENIECMTLLDWVVVPPCPSHGSMCGICPACMFRTSWIHYMFFHSVE
jgi:hypothetical protein